MHYFTPHLNAILHLDRKGSIYIDYSLFPQLLLPFSPLNSGRGCVHFFRARTSPGYYRYVKNKRNRCNEACYWATGHSNYKQLQVSGQASAVWTKAGQESKQKPPIITREYLVECARSEKGELFFLCCWPDSNKCSISSQDIRWRRFISQRNGRSVIEHIIVNLIDLAVPINMTFLSSCFLAPFMLTTLFVAPWNI